MGSQEWFRTDRWDRDARADFESRLARSRGHNRPQYLRIKGAALRDAGHGAAAAGLWSRVVEQYPDSLDAAHCAELLGDLAMDARDVTRAEARYRESLALRPDQNGTTGEVHIGLAEALLAQGRHQEALQALDLVPAGDLTLDHAVCRWNAALAEAADGVRDRPVAQAAAARALALLDAPDQFSRHPGVGRAALGREQVARLRRLAPGDAPVSGPSRRWGRRRE